jgi:hypothetical protein
MILFFMKKIDDRMMKMENKMGNMYMIKENGREIMNMGNMENSIKENGRELREMGNRMKEYYREMGNRIIENVREALTSVTTDMQQRTNQGTESKPDKVKIISVPAPGQIKTSTDTVQCDKSESFEAQIKHHSKSFHSKEDVQKPATLAIQAHATIDPGLVVGQQERTCNGDNSTDQAEGTLFNTDELNSSGSGLHGGDMMSSISRSQVICGNFTEIPKTGIESEDNPTVWRSAMCSTTSAAIGDRSRPATDN